MSELNPYQQYGSATYTEPTGDSKELPTFSVVVLIVDLFLCALRGLIGVTTVFALLSFEPGSPLFIISCLELIAAVGIVITGGFGNVLTLLKKPIGIMFCWGAVGFTVFSMVVGLGVIPFQMEQMQQNPAFVQNPDAAWIGMIIGAGVTMLIRIAILVAYVVAVRMASRALR